MAQFISFSPDVEVLGIAMHSVVAGLGDEGQSILVKYGLGKIELTEWYSQQRWLNAFREIATGRMNAMFNLVAIGMKIPETAIFPPDIDTITAGLYSIDVAYHMNHRGGEIGCYRAEVINENQIDLICENPYPDDFDYGLIYGTARRFCPNDHDFSVYHDNDAPCRKKGDSSCTYHVVFKPQ
jgi:hypothetical protein